VYHETAYLSIYDLDCGIGLKSGQLSKARSRIVCDAQEPKATKDKTPVTPA